MVLLGFWRSFTTGSHPSYRSCRKWWLAGHTQRSPWFLKWMFVPQKYLVSWFSMVFLMVFDVFLIHLHIHVVYQCHNAYHTLHYITLHIYIDHSQHPHGSSLRFSRSGCWQHWGCVQEKNEHQIQPVKIQVCFLRPSAAACRGCMAFRERSVGARQLWWAQEFFNNHGEIVEICWDPGNLMWMYFCDSICLWKTIFGW